MPSYEILDEFPDVDAPTCSACKERGVTTPMVKVREFKEPSNGHTICYWSCTRPECELNQDNIGKCSQYLRGKLDIRRKMMIPEMANKLVPPIRPRKLP